MEAAVKPDTVHENGEEYGYQLWPHSADHTYMFNGMFGQYVVVAPDLDLVLAVNAGAGNLFTRSRSYTAVREFLKAVARAPAPLPADPAGRRAPCLYGGASALRRGCAGTACSRQASLVRACP